MYIIVYMSIGRDRKVSLFPKLTSEGNRIYCMKFYPTTDNDVYDVLMGCKASLAVLDLQLKLEPMYGNIILYDLKHVRLSQFLCFTPTITKNLMTCSIVSICVVYGVVDNQHEFRRFLKDYNGFCCR